MNLPFELIIHILTFLNPCDRIKQLYHKKFNYKDIAILDQLFPENRYYYGSERIQLQMPGEKSWVGKLAYIFKDNLIDRNLSIWSEVNPYLSYDIFELNVHAVEGMSVIFAHFVDESFVTDRITITLVYKGNSLYDGTYLSEYQSSFMYAGNCDTKANFSLRVSDSDVDINVTSAKHERGNIVRDVMYEKEELIDIIRNSLTFTDDGETLRTNDVKNLYWIRSSWL